MATVLAVDESLAKHVIEHLPDGNRALHYDGALEDVHDQLAEREGPRRLVEFCQEANAAVLVLGVRLGGNRYFAMDVARDLLVGSRPMPRPPAIIVVVRATTMALAKHAWEIGCYSIVETDRPDRERISRIVADEVLLAKAWREGRGERASFGLAPRRQPKRARATRAKRQPKP